MKWLRWYRDTCGDGKFQIVARNGGVTVATVIGVWAILLEDAGSVDHRGVAIKGIRHYALVLDLAEAVVEKIIDGMKPLNLLSGDTEYTITNWHKRQFETDARDGTNSRRQKRWRDKRHRNGTVTVCDGPDTDTDTESKSSALHAEKAVKGKSRKRPSHPIPDSWKPSENSTLKAKQLGLSDFEIGREASKFRNHAKQSDRRAVLWDAAFDNWCIKAVEFMGREPKSEQKPGYSAPPGSPEFMAWKAYANDTGKKSFTNELNKRELEGRPFDFETQWPPRGQNVSQNSH